MALRDIIMLKSFKSYINVYTHPATPTTTVSSVLVSVLDTSQ